MTLKQRFLGGKPIWIRYMLIIGVATMITRLVLDSKFATTSFFYCLVPYLIGAVSYTHLTLPTKA